MSIAFRIFLFVFFCKPFSYRMSNETLHHGATSSGFWRRYRGYVFSLPFCAAGPLSTFPSFIHLKHNTGGWFWENLDFVFILSYCLPPTAAQSNHRLEPQRRSELWELRSSIYFPQNDEKIARTISNPVILIENQDAISCASYFDTQYTSLPYWLVAQYNI